MRRNDAANKQNGADHQNESLQMLTNEHTNTQTKYAHMHDSTSATLQHAHSHNGIGVFSTPPTGDLRGSTGFT